MPEQLAALFYFPDRVFMYEALKDIACVVTAFISFLYGTRIAWGFGKKSVFTRDHDHRIQFLFESIPSAAVLYFVGFMVVFKFWVIGTMTLVVFSLTSALLLSLLVVAVSMPELKRKENGQGVVVELVDGAVCRLARETFNYYLSTGKIAKFKRAGGWAIVGKDPLRNDVSQAIYVGVDRRKEP